ncbi:MAG: hypothetical protein O9327_05105 [Polaromonas sp.]|nr:hypothetical protein [Polaromonas sp.]
MNSTAKRFDAPPAATAQRGPVVRARRHKVSVLATGEILSLAAAKAMNAGSLGAITALIQATLERPDLLESGSLQSIDQARLAMGMRGATAQDIEFSFMALFSAGIAVREEPAGESLTIPILDRVIAETLAGAVRRSQGWSKRGRQESSSDLDLSNPTKSSRSPRSDRAEASGAAVQGAPMGPKEPKEAKAPKRKAAVASAIELRAPGHAAAGGEDPLFIELPCKGGVQVPVHQSYVRSLRETFPTIDVEEQIRLAVAWCRVGEEAQGTPTAKQYAQRLKLPVAIKGFVTKWMSRATQDAAIRREVRRHSTVGRNGFGNGGSYEQATAPASPTPVAGQRALSEGLDDLLADVNGSVASHQPDSPEPIQASFSDLDRVEVPPTTAAHTEVREGNSSLTPLSAQPEPKVSSLLQRLRGRPTVNLYASK